MSFLPQLFLSNIKAKDGLAKPSRFQVILPIPAYVNSFIGQNLFEEIVNFRNSIFADITTQVAGTTNEGANPAISRYLALQCESAELPGKTLQTADVSIYGPNFKVPVKMEYADTTLNFICTNEFYERKLFDRWLESIIPNDTHNVRFSKGRTTRYLTNIKIVQYDDFIKQIYAVELIDAFPVSIAAQPLSWGEDNFHILSVQFTYQRYRTIYNGAYDLGAAASALFGASVSGIPLKAILNSEINQIGATLKRIF